MVNQKSGHLSTTWKYMAKLTRPKLTLNSTAALRDGPGVWLPTQQNFPPSWCIPKPAKLSPTPDILFIEAPAGIMYQIKLSLFSCWFLRAVALINHPVLQARATSRWDCLGAHPSIRGCVPCPSRLVVSIPPPALGSSWGPAPHCWGPFGWSPSAKSHLPDLGALGDAPAAKGPDSCLCLEMFQGGKNEKLFGCAPNLLNSSPTSLHHPLPPCLASPPGSSTEGAWVSPMPWTLLWQRNPDLFSLPSLHHEAAFFPATQDLGCLPLSLGIFLGSTNVLLKALDPISLCAEDEMQRARRAEESRLPSAVRIHQIQWFIHFNYPWSSYVCIYICTWIHIMTHN